MREWNLAGGDPLALCLAADFRLSNPDYPNDHIWELVLGSGDPPALALRTTYGMRALDMRIFPGFRLGGQTRIDPSSFAVPPAVHSFYPNYLRVGFSPFTEIQVSAEYWIPDSHTAAGRLIISNGPARAVLLQLDLCGQLVPLEGQPLLLKSYQSVHVLAGSSSKVAPVLFLTGGPQPGPGPYPALTVDLDLAAGGTRSLTWVQAALGSQDESFDWARRTAARPWEAELAKIELVNAGGTFDIQTGDSDWDAAFAFGQKTALGLFFGPSQHLPEPSFVEARAPDHGYSPSGNGSDYPDLWAGQTALDAYYLTSLLPGSPELGEGLVRNFLAVQSDEGFIDWKPGLAGQRGRWLATPLLAVLLERSHSDRGDPSLVGRFLERSSLYYQAWFNQDHDRDQDGFPEWDHLLQSGLEDSLDFTLWHPAGEGASICCVENPALAAMLCAEFKSLARLADQAHLPEQGSTYRQQAAALSERVEECWNEQAGLYHNRDRDSHLSPAGMEIATLHGSGKFQVEGSFDQPVRLLVRVQLNSESSRRPAIQLQGRGSGRMISERLGAADFLLGSGRAAATTRKLFTHLNSVRVDGLSDQDQVVLQVMDFGREDISLFLPLWAGIPQAERARRMVQEVLFTPERFGRQYGIPASAAPSRLGEDPEVDAVRQAVRLPWNQLVGEGLLAYGLRQEAARLIGNNMSAIIRNLKTQRAFSSALHAANGAPLGERNSAPGLPPLGLFLQVLGVRIESPERVALSGKNPFPWPVTVQYRGLRVTRELECTRIVFPDGRAAMIDDPADVTVTAEPEAA